MPQKRRAFNGRPKSRQSQASTSRISGNGNGNGNGQPDNGHERSAPSGAESKRSMPQRDWPQHRIIVIGASAGGVEAITRIVSTLPPTLPAAVFVVLHIPSHGPSLMPEILNRAAAMPASHPKDGQEIKPGKIYVAPPDLHLLVKPGRVCLSRGPRENNARPALDALFRTAAQSYGPWVIGVVLSGGLDDGTMGLISIKQRGGIGVVQDPNDALFPGMPTSAVENASPDYVVPLAEISPLLVRLASLPVPQHAGAHFMSRAKRDEADVAEVGTDALKSSNMSGPPSKFTCPECGGALWELEDEKLLRYRCHVGHGYSAESLIAAHDGSLEDVMWSALRALEESAALRRRMAERARRGAMQSFVRRYEEQAQEAEARAGVIRKVLTASKEVAPSGELVEHKAMGARDRSIERAPNSRQRAPARAKRRRR